MKSSALDKLEKQLPEMARLGVRRAYLYHLRAGRAILIVKDGKIYRRKKGEKDVFIQKLSPGRKVTIGKKFVL